MAKPSIVMFFFFKVIFYEVKFVSKSTKFHALEIVIHEQIKISQ